MICTAEGKDSPMSVTRMSTEWTGLRSVGAVDVAPGEAAARRQTRSLRLRLMALVLAMLLPLAALATLRAWVQAEREREIAETGLIHSAVTLANALDREVREAIALVEVAIALDAETPDRPADLKARLDAIASSRPYFTLSLSDQPPPLSLRFTSPLTLAGPESPALGIEIPYAHAGQGRNAIRITLSQAHLQQFLMEHPLPPRSISAIIDGRGRVAARNVRPEQLVGTPVIAAVRDGLARQESGLTRTTNVEGVESSIAFARATLTGFATAISLPSAMFQESAMGSALTMLAYALTAILMAGGMALVMAHRISRELRRVVDDVAAGRAPRAGFAEIAGLEAAYRQAEAQRDQSVAALRDQEHHLRAILDAIPVAVIVFDEALQTLFANRRALADAAGLPNLTPEQRDSRVHPDDLPVLKDWRRRWQRSGNPGAIELRYLVQGSYRWHRFHGVSLRPQSGGAPVFLAITVDEHDAHEANEELARLNRQLEVRIAERTNALSSAAAQLTDEISHQEALRRQLAVSQKREALGQLTAGIAHDINNILAVISNAFSVIEHARTGQEIDQSLAIGRNAARHAAALIHNLTAFSRPQTASPRAIDMSVVLPEIISLCRHSLDEAWPLTLDVLSPLPSATLDAELLQAALLNLVSNARHAMPQGGTIRVTADVVPCACGDRARCMTAEKTCLCLSVTDTGCGMTDEEIAHASEAFFTTRADSGGSGLGLEMVDGFVRQCGGTMRIISAPGHGTTVTLFLPMLPCRVAEPAELAKEPPLRETRSPRTILIVDDNRALLHSSSLLLRTLGFAVLEANSGPTAMALAEQHEDIDLVLTDIAMPGETGTELAERLHQIRPDLPVIFLTGYAGDATIAAAHRVLSKPISVDQLVGAIHDTLEAGAVEEASKARGSAPCPRQGQGSLDPFV